MDELCEELIEQGLLQSEDVINAFCSLDRKDFVPRDSVPFAYANEPLSIGHGQTISQPGVVAMMLELLSVKMGDNVLDVGYGSGWTTALLAKIVGEEGKVTALELVPELAEFGRKNVANYDLLNVEMLNKSAREGHESNAPYDRILASASIHEDSVPVPWEDQLKEGGLIVVPIKNSIWKLKKTKDGMIKEEHKGYSFVPFI